MLVTQITAKTITITAEPGDRINVNSEGYGIQSITVKCPDGVLKTSLKNVIKKINSGADDSNLRDIRLAVLEDVLALPVHKSHRVFVGHSY